MDNQTPTSFLFRCDHCIPWKPIGSLRSVPLIDWLALAGLLPCWGCSERIVLDAPAADDSHAGHFFICIGCGRSWLVERGGNPETLVLRVSIPDYESGRSWKWSRHRKVPMRLGNPTSVTYCESGRNLARVMSGRGGSEEVVSYDTIHWAVVWLTRFVCCRMQ